MGGSPFHPTPPPTDAAVRAHEDPDTTARQSVMPELWGRRMAERAAHLVEEVT
jgi:hypothetical protein